MPKSIDEVHQELSGKYMGRAGIHGMGVRRSADTIVAYVTPGPHPDREQTLDALKQDAAPYGVIAVESQRARLS